MTEALQRLTDRLRYSPAVFETVGVKQAGRNSSTVIGLRLDSGAYGIGEGYELPPGVRKGEVVTTILKSRDYTVTIRPNGDLERVCTDELSPDFKRSDEVADFISAVVERHEVFYATVGEGEVVQLTDSPIEDVIVVTEKIAPSEYPLVVI